MFAFICGAVLGAGVSFIVFKPKIEDFERYAKYEKSVEDSINQENAEVETIVVDGDDESTENNEYPADEDEL